jgi:tritrans,polycis-undecaprenyl-diphosphate synthase [geranylgeranyl-diphosphate specific]
MKPRHIAVIMNGHRRYAEEAHMPLYNSYEQGMRRLDSFLEWCKEERIREVTVFALSINNLKRPKLQLDILFSIFRMWTKKLLDNPPRATRIQFIGRRELLPKDIQGLIAKIEEKTSKGKQYKINIAMAYDGRDEITRAVNKCLNLDEITQDNLHVHLDLQSEPDLIIRTAESRLSGFLTWQSSYSELIFLPELYWPIFQKKDFKACLEEFERRKRTYGQ